MRTVSLTDDANGSPTQAAAYAEKAIANLDPPGRRAVYAPYQQAAGVGG